LLGHSFAARRQSSATVLVKSPAAFLSSMEDPAKRVLQIGAWRVHSATGEISREGETVRLEARSMLLLLCLAEHAGEIVSIDDLLSRVWSGVAVSPDSVYQAVASLRRQLGDDPRQPTYIATVPRLGYRMIAAVAPWTDDATGGSSLLSRTAPENLNRYRWPLAALALLVVVVVAAWAVVMRSRDAKTRSASAALASPNQQTVAVLPFLDLTDGMKEEEFADGMTEELIDTLSKIPDFRVPTATASFFYKDKKVAPAEIARTLGVTYVLDGSVRKSAARFRVAARLVRAENGYVVWSESYDRPLVDKLLVQEDIAAEVAKALRASIDTR
jgi:transcriptional activator of cad operon